MDGSHGGYNELLAYSNLTFPHSSSEIMTKSLFSETFIFDEQTALFVYYYFNTRFVVSIAVLSDMRKRSRDLESAKKEIELWSRTITFVTSLCIEITEAELVWKAAEIASVIRHGAGLYKQSVAQLATRLPETVEAKVPPPLSPDDEAAFRHHVNVNPWSKSGLRPADFISSTYAYWLRDERQLHLTLIRSAGEEALVKAYNVEVCRYPGRAVKGLYVRPHKARVDAPRSILTSRVADLTPEQVEARHAYEKGRRDSKLTPEQIEARQVRVERRSRKDARSKLRESSQPFRLPSPS